MTKVAVLYSGGLDSSTIFGELVELEKKGTIDKVYLLSFDDDSTNFKTRRSIAIEQVAQHYGMYDRVKFIRMYRSEELRGTDTFGFIPAYKLSMQIAAMGYCQKLGVSRLYMGYNRENNDYAYTFKDELEHNIIAAAKLYNEIYDSNIEIVNPYLEMTKAEIILIGNNIDVPFEKTISCRATRFGGLVHCGRCLPCHSRMNGFKTANIDDPTDYWYTDGQIEKVVYGKEGTISFKKQPVNEDIAMANYYAYIEQRNAINYAPWSSLSEEQRQPWYDGIK